MTQRIPCKTEGCKGSILPITAEETGGFCMPCVQKRNHEEEQAYVRTNKKTLNLFEGISDPVEIIKIYHQPRSYDPLIEYVSYPQPIDQVYLSLSQNQIAALIDYTLKCFQKEDAEIATEITIELVSFLNADVSDILEVLFDREEYYPGFIFKDASPVLRDKLFTRLWSADNTLEVNHILSALAWIGDDVVVKFFSEPSKFTSSDVSLFAKMINYLKKVTGFISEDNQKNSFKDYLLVDPINYTRVAGWELSKDHQKRLLYFDKCYPFVKRNIQSGDSLHSTFQEAEEKCQGCGSQLMSLIKLDLSENHLDFIDIKSPYLNIGTCLKCDDWNEEAFFTEMSHDGQMSWSKFNKKPIEQPEESFFWSIPEPDFLELSTQPRSSYHGVFWGGLPIQYSQIGGFPTWIQAASYPSCPGCKETMVFIGQLDNEDCIEYSEGIHYFFICSPCMLTTTVYQQS